MKKVLVSFAQTTVINLDNQQEIDVLVVKWDKYHVFKDTKNFERFSVFCDKYEPVGNDRKGLIERRHHRIQTKNQKSAGGIVSSLLERSTRYDEVSSKMATPSQRGRYHRASK